MGIITIIWPDFDNPLKLGREDDNNPRDVYLKYALYEYPRTCTYFLSAKQILTDIVRLITSSTVLVHFKLIFIVSESVSNCAWRWHLFNTCNPKQRTTA